MTVTIARTVGASTTVALDVLVEVLRGTRDA
jgi:hypothetical protein